MSQTNHPASKTSVPPPTEELWRSQSCPCSSGVGLSGWSQMTRKLHCRTFQFQLRNQTLQLPPPEGLGFPEAASRSREWRWRFASFLVRTTGDLHLFKPPTFTFILNESILVKKRSLWSVCTKVYAPAVPPNRPPQNSDTNNTESHSHSAMPSGSTQAAGACSDHSNFL